MRYTKSPREFPREIFTNDVFSALAAIIRQQEYMMAAIDDLTTAVTNAVAALTAAHTTIQSLQAQLGTPVATEDQLEGLASQLNAGIQVFSGSAAQVAAATPVDPAPVDPAPAAS